MPGPRSSLVEVALPVPVRRLFTYRVAGAPPPAGTAVRVPFQSRTLTGWVVGRGTEMTGVRDVLGVLDSRPAAAGELLELARWIASYYVAPLGVVLRAMLPAPGRAAPQRRLVARVVRPIGTLVELEGVFGRAQRQREAFEALVQAGGWQTVAALAEKGFSRSVVAGLEKKGLVRVASEAVVRDPFRGAGAGGEAALTPTAGQRAVLARLVRAAGRRGGTFLLHGVTSSGKTLVYIELIRKVLEGGRDALVLVPEIALTPQTVSRFRQAFGDQVAVLHSGLSDGERFDAWMQLRAGEKRIAVGARSAVFAPVRRLGVIVVDEEHDGSYKQSESPRYHARDVAVVRATRAGAVCLLGSATPSLESWANADSGKYALLELPDRVGGGVLPEVRVVDLRTRPEGDGGQRITHFTHFTQSGRSPESAKAGGSRAAGPRAAETRAAEPAEPPLPPRQVISPELFAALGRRLARNEQTILLLNRRGYASFALCQSCGEVMECLRCSVAMTLHRARRRMICHHCGHTAPPPPRCARCDSGAISYRGLGTEQVERILMDSLPRARIARMDVDTTGGKWSHRDILDRVGAGKVDILIGTQMIAKGLDFHRVTLVGVINADIGLHFPDFRSCERTFQLLSQVAGRAGRGPLGGEVIIQTYVPDHYVVRAAVAHDYRGFVERELNARSDPRYPPRVRMARIVVSSPVQEKALQGAEALERWLRRRVGRRPEVLGPAPAPIEKLHGRFRWHLLLRGGAADVGRALKSVADERRPPGAGMRISLDRDPLHLM